MERTLQNYQAAINYNERYLEINKKIGNKRGECAALGNLGNTYRVLRKYELALKYFSHSIVVARETGNKVAEANSLHNLGRVWIKLRDYEKAMQCLVDSYAIKKKIGTVFGKAMTLREISKVHIQEKNYGRAIDCLELAIKSLSCTYLLRDEAIARWELSRVLKRAGKKDKALNKAESSLTILKNIHNDSYCDLLAKRIQKMLEKWSKKLINCPYCHAKVREDNIESHISKVHSV